MTSLADRPHAQQLSIANKEINDSICPGGMVADPEITS